MSHYQDLIGLYSPRCFSRQTGNGHSLVSDVDILTMIKYSDENQQEEHIP